MDHPHSPRDSERLTRAQLPGSTRREFFRVSGLVGLAAAGSWSLAGCGLFDNESPEGGGKGSGERTLRLSFVPVEVLDPQVITNGMWILSRGILEGLVTQNPAGNDVVPAVAEKWTISPDKLTYTFQLRQDAMWSNGKPVLASDFERTYKRLFTPAGTSAGGTTLGANSYQSSTNIKGAVDFLSGVLTDWSQVGVKASGERELVLTLANPNPDFLLALTHPALLPMNMDQIEAMPEDWGNPPNYVSNGPYAVSKWTKNSSIELVPNEKYWDRKNVKLDRIDVQLVDPATSAGTVTVPYENNETDMVNIFDADVVRFEKSPELRKQLQSIPTYSIVYLAKLRSENPTLDDVRVRRAISLSLGRETLAKVSPGMRPGVSLVTDRTQGWDDSIAIKEDIAQAKQLLAQAGFPDGKGLPEIRILAGVTSPMVDAIVDSLSRNLGIKVKADIVEGGVYTTRRWQVQKGDYIGYYYGTFAGLPTWPTMVGTLWSPKDNQMFSLPAARWTEYQNIQLDKNLKPADRTAKLNDILAKDAAPETRKMADLVAQATREQDQAKQLDLFKQAAKIREEQALYIPVMWTAAYFAVRPTMKGLQLRPYPDYFYLKPLDVEAS